MTDDTTVLETPPGVGPDDLPAAGTADIDSQGAPAGSSALTRVESVLSVISPLTSSPGAPLETTNFIRSVQPSLMPRTSLHQGAVRALSILSARKVSNVVERLTLLADAGEVKLEDLPPELSGRPQGEGGFRLPAQGLSWEAHEREVLRQALELSGGNRARAARLLDLPYKAFLYRLEKHDLAEPGTAET